MGKIGIGIFIGVMVGLIILFIRWLIKLNPIKKVYDKKKQKVSFTFVPRNDTGFISELEGRPFISKTERKK